jgi:hypothetical protein
VLRVFIFILCFSSLSLRAQWHPITPKKVNDLEGYLFFYDYFFEAEKAEEISQFKDSVFLQKLKVYRFSRPNYLLEVYLPQKRLYRYYCLRSRADGQEIAVIESNFKQLLKELVHEKQYSPFLIRSIPAPSIAEGFFYADQFFFQAESKLILSAERTEKLEELKILRTEVLDDFMQIVKKDLAKSH